MSRLKEAWSNLEPGCAEIAKGARSVPDANQLIFLSAATSLKRIADFLTGDLEVPANPKNNLNNVLSDRIGDMVHDLNLKG